ncbi:putative zinc ribbon protein [Escherichia coli]|uniref:putative zinc ribbon protein n=1 Tax=Escherichia coli TaxID=562 RepID=UPI003EDF905C
MFAKFFLAHNGKRCSLVCQTDRYITEHPSRGTGMRMLKCYLANNRDGHIVTAKDAMQSPSRVWTCSSCGCQLILHAGSSGEAPWFEHDQRTVTTNVLMQCTHLDPEVKAEARCQKIRSIIGNLDAPVMVLFWYCVWCGNHYSGKKHCTSCGTGIYSIEETEARIT